jgi:hypothetical protein
VVVTILNVPNVTIIFVGYALSTLRFVETVIYILGRFMVEWQAVQIRASHSQHQKTSLLNVTRYILGQSGEIQYLYSLSCFATYEFVRSFRDINMAEKGPQQS